MHQRSCDRKIFDAAAYYLPQKNSFLRYFFYKTGANTPEMLPVQTGLYRYDE